MLHVAQISFLADTQRRSPEQLLRDWHSLPDVARAARDAGARVSVIQASMVEANFLRDGVEYYFLAPDRNGARLTGSARFATLLGSIAPDVIHVHGLCFGREFVALRALLPHVPMLLQDHAEPLPRIWRRRQWKVGAAAADAFAFHARAQAEPFQRHGLIAPRAEIFEIPETTCHFTPGDRHMARVATGVHGDPAVLWVGHLNDNKDPLTVLDGFAAAARQLPGMRLWCCYPTAPLQGAVEARIRADATLRDRVTLLGRVPRERVQELMRAADLFVLGSRREGSGYSVIEALASGLPPVVTDIPSFRVLVGTERDAGALWRPGDAVELTTALIDCAARLGQLRAGARARFEREGSAAALGRKLLAAYQRLADSSGARLRA